MRLICFFAALLSLPALADDASTGSIKGTITLKGAPPKLVEPALPADLGEKDKAFCLKKKPLVPPFYVTDSASHLKDVVVWLEGVKGTPPASTSRSLVNTECRFEPHVQAVTVGDELKVENRDPLLHNTHPVYLGDKSTLFNIALPEQGQEVKKKLKKPGVLKVQCDAGHVWMRAFVHVFDHGFHATSAADGTFTISGVPAGKYTLKAWHEAAGTLTQEIEISAGAQAQKDFSFDAKATP